MGLGSVCRGTGSLGDLHMGTLSRLQWGALATPLALCILFLLGSAGLFFYGPIEWPPTNRALLAIYLSFAFALIVLGFIGGIRAPAAKETPLNWLWIVATIGAIAHILLLFPAAYVYTGSMPWDFVKALEDQRAAYEHMQRVLAEGMPFRGVVAGARALLGPATVVLPALSVLLWSRMGQRLKVVVVIGLLALFAFSIYRGTDKEVFDIALLQLSSLAVVVARYVASQNRFPGARFTASLVVVLLVVGMIIGSFLDRKADRVGFDAEDRVEQAQASPSMPSSEASAIAPAFCMAGTVCSSSLNGGSTVGEVQANFALSMVTAYAAQGYYGLSLALEQPFQSMFGFGHSSLLTRAYTALTDDATFEHRALTTRLTEHGWDVSHQWPTAYVWLANDLGLWGAAVFVGVLAFIWGLAWKDAIFAKNDAAALVFCQLAVFFVYLPAHAVMLQVADGYFALLAWLAIWAVSRSPSALRRLGLARA